MLRGMVDECRKQNTDGALFIGMPVLLRTGSLYNRQHSERMPANHLTRWHQSKRFTLVLAVLASKGRCNSLLLRIILTSQVVAVGLPSRPQFSEFTELQME